VTRLGNDEPPGPPRPKGLTREEFEALLAQLDPDRERAGERYEIIRHKLVRLFEWRGCDAPEDLTDETFNRVARRMREGIELRSRGTFGYFYGVAHLVFKEVLRKASRERRALESGGWPPPDYLPEVDDSHLECLRRCLDRLSAEQRDLVLRYHQSESHIRSRQVLAGELGIPLNALRIRVYRLRRKLETCVHECLESSARETFH
jgi:DNA-directed RNA polymerase specialized sigma24 family protein